MTFSSDDFYMAGWWCDPVILGKRGINQEFLSDDDLKIIAQKPDFIAYDHHHTDMLSFRLNKVLYKITTVAWTIKSQEELERAKKWYDLQIFDSFIPTEWTK